MQDQLSVLRGELAVLRSAGAEHLAKSSRAVLESFTEVAAQRAAVNHLIEETRERLSALSAQSQSLTDDVTALKDAQTNFKFARETSNGEILDVPSFLPRRSVN